MKKYAIDYQFDEQQGLVIATLTEVIKNKDIIRHYRYLKENFQHLQDLRVLILANEKEFDISVQETRGLTPHLEACLREFNSVKEAIVIQNSYATAIAMIFKDLYQSPHFEFKIFSLETSAKRWLTK